ncbi:SDR family oxidoreductase [Sinorhizobium medicae]|nr:SDR family oxidoreductase [Sinorhizobium medicae]
MSNGPVLLVTGGSRGIGAAIALAAASEGWRVAVNYASNRNAAEEVVRRILQAGGTAVSVEGDVGREEGVKAIFAAVDSVFGRLDGLVNNAGIIGPPQRVDEISPERDRAAFPHQCDRLHPLRRRGGAPDVDASRRAGGSIVNLSSIAAVLGAPGQYVDYAATKGAIDSFTVGLARETATEGIRVNAVRPGVIDTEIHASGGLPDRARDLAPTIPMQRPGTAGEVADAILYLLSDKATYVTGTILTVSGGR